jgi:anaerobic magnesium-protoporphyrin IX monomethyl ester cyclase
MPDILLIQPPIRDFYLTAKRTIPYGLACIAPALIKSGFSVKILDALATSKSRACDLPREMDYLRKYYGRSDKSAFALFHQYRHFGYSFDHIGKMAKESGAFLVGISSLFTPYMQEALQTAETVKARHPECKIVIGGHHPSAMPQSVMESAAVDFVIRGEGEVSLHLLAEAVSKGGAYNSIPGLVFRRKNGAIHINPPARMQHLDDHPLPAADLLNHRFYRRNKCGAMVIVAGRGCPMTCSYCSVGAGSYLNYRKRSVDSVIDEIQRGVDQYDVGFIDFEDENLSLDRRWFLKLLGEIKRRFSSNGVELRAMNGLYPPSLDKEVIRAMQAAGFRALNLSLGSTSAEQLKRFNRSDVRAAFDRALKLAEDYGLNAVGYVICAAPFQSAEDSISDLLYLAQRRVLAGVSIFYPAPGSKDFDLCKNIGLLPDHFSCMRSSALPVAHTTGRQEAVTVLRLARILNFMKSLIDTGICIEMDATPGEIRINNPADRMETSKQLLSKFLHDGKIRGVTTEGEIFEHLISEKLTHAFLTGLAAIDLRGSQ